MKRKTAKTRRVLAIAPSSRGFGFAVMEGNETLVDWGAKSVKGDKNAQCIQKTDELITQYQPDILATQDFEAKDCRRAARIRELGRDFVNLAKQHKIKAAALSRSKVRAALFAGRPGTKHDQATMLANRFPAELGFRLPPKRRPWMSEDSRMDIFEAVALTLVL